MISKPFFLDILYLYIFDVKIHSINRFVIKICLKYISRLKKKYESALECSNDDITMHNKKLDTARGEHGIQGDTAIVCLTCISFNCQKQVPHSPVLKRNEVQMAQTVEIFLIFAYLY